MRYAPIVVWLLAGCAPVDIRCATGEHDNTCYCADKLSLGTADRACDVNTIAPTAGHHAICCANQDYPQHTSTFGSICSCFEIADGTGCPGTSAENGTLIDTTLQDMTQEVTSCN